MGGTASHPVENDSFTPTLRCHGPTGKIYPVAFTRDRITPGSYEDDGIRMKVETWADGVPVLV